MPAGREEQHHATVGIQLQTSARLTDGGTRFRRVECIPTRCAGHEDALREISRGDQVAARARSEHGDGISVHGVHLAGDVDSELCVEPVRELQRGNSCHTGRRDHRSLEVVVVAAKDDESHIARADQVLERFHDGQLAAEHAEHVFEEPHPSLG